MDAGNQTYTPSDRARIRDALLAYATEHRIGVPTLRVRIAKATGRTRNLASGDDPYLIDQKTLQRFLKDSHRTNDAFIVPLAQFVAANWSARDQVAEFAASTGQFFGIKPAEGGQTVLEGEFCVLSEKRPTKPVLDYPTQLEQLSTIKLSPLDGGGARAAEHVALPEDKRPANFDGYQLTYEGVVCSRPEPMIMILRNTLTGYPKSYWFYQSGTEGEYYGFCSLQPFEKPEKISSREWRPQIVYLDQKVD